MPVPTPGSTILVTGASGFIAVWCVKQLLERNFKVIGTVRSASKGEYLVNLFKGQPFKYVIVEDIEKPDSFSEAVKGVSGILHTASPFHMNVTHPSDLIGPAVQGTVGVLKAANYAGSDVKRVVVTSSVAAILEPSSKIREFTEKDWNEYSPKRVEELGDKTEPGHVYRASKSLAEKAAWDFIATDKPPFDLSVINPPMVFGPILHQVESPEKLNTSVANFYKILQGSLKKEDLPAPGGTGGGSWVDVREIATAHVEALVRPEAGGERFLVSAGPYSLQDFTDTLNKHYPQLTNVPVGEPGAAEKANDHSTLFNLCLGTKATQMLGVQFRPIEDSTVDMYESLRERGWGGQ